MSSVSKGPLLKTNDSDIVKEDNEEQSSDLVLEAPNLFNENAFWNENVDWS
jgi:hypothetical protein